MDKAQLNAELRSCTDSEKFFDILEKCVKFQIPIQLKKILDLNLCNSLVALSGPIEKSIHEMENFMRKFFQKSMLDKNEKMSDYLGNFTNNQKDFQFMCGQKQILSVLSNFCNVVYSQNDVAQSVTEHNSEDVTPPLPSIYGPSESSCKGDLFSIASS